MERRLLLGNVLKTIAELSIFQHEWPVHVQPLTYVTRDTQHAVCVEAA